MNSNDTTLSAGGATGTLSLRSLAMQAYIWLGVPLPVFLAGWLRWYVALPLIILLLAAVGWRFRRGMRGTCFKSPHFSAVRISPKLWWMAVVLLLFTIFCGIGGISWQLPADNFYRNALFYDLVRRPWPVVYADGSILCYYFGYWLPAALVAKGAGGSILAGDIALALYTAWGLFIALCLITSYTGGRPRWLILLLFLFLGGGELAMTGVKEISTLTGADPALLIPAYDPGFYDLSNMALYMLYIFHQGVPAMVGCLLLLFESRRPEAMLLPFSMMLMCAPIPCVALLTVLVPWLLYNRRRALSPSNIVGILLCVLISLFYLANNTSGAGFGPFTEASPLVWMECALIWLLFYIGIYLPFIWREVRRNWVFWTLLAASLLAPLVSIGGERDFGWRFGIPLSIYITLLAIDAASRVTDWRRPRNILFACVLAFGSFNAVQRYYEVLRHAIVDGIRNHSPRKLTTDMTLLSDPAYNECYDNFMASGESFFSRHLLKPQRNEK